MTWSTPGWVVLMSLCLGIGAGLLTFIGMRIINSPRVPADKAVARDELEIAVRRVINTNMLLSEACRDLADLCRTLPPEYKPIAEHTLRFAKLMEEATYAEGVNDRIFPRPLFTADEAVVVPESGVPATVPVGGDALVGVPPPANLEAWPDPSADDGTWVAGQLLR